MTCEKCRQSTAENSVQIPITNTKFRLCFMCETCIKSLETWLKEPAK